MGYATQPGAVKVLLVGKNAKGCSFLLEHLKKQGCECRMATSCPEAARLAADCHFDLVLCIGKMDRVSELIASFIGSPTTLFRCYPVEESSWWMPAVWQGVECGGVPALRPSEFAAVLGRLVEEISPGKAPAREMKFKNGGGHWFETQASRAMQSCESPAGSSYNDLLRRSVSNGQEDPGQM